MQNVVQTLQETLEHEIPITRYLGLRVTSYNENGLALQAPLAPNINHKHTAFAGSLNAVVTLAGWGLLWLILQEHKISARVVLQDSVCSYLRPVNNDFSAHCRKPGAEQLARMVDALQKRGKARIALNVEIRNETVVAVAFRGRYVIMLTDRDTVQGQLSQLSHV